jgi:hypothetical protein
MNPKTGTSHEQPLVRTGRWGLAWIGLCLALALHVVDEALNGFLGFYNPMVESLGLPMPTFAFKVWLTCLMVGLLILLALSRLAFRGMAVMRPLSWLLGILMVANGLGHLVMSAWVGRLIPGSYSSPVLVAAAAFLLVETSRDRRRTA